MKFKTILTPLLLTAFFLSCMTEKKAREVAKDFYRDHPGELAESCAEKFPPVIEYKPGKPVIIPGDTVFIPGDSVECPQGPDNSILPVKVKCPDSKIIRDTVRIVDTAEVESGSKISALQFALDKKTAEANNLQGQLTATEKERDTARSGQTKNFYIILGLLAIIAVYVFLKLKKLF